MQDESNDLFSKINKPNPALLKKEIESYKGKRNLSEPIGILESGNHVLIEGLYSNGLELLSALQSYLKKNTLIKVFKNNVPIVRSTADYPI